MTSVNLTIYQLFMILFWYIVVSKSTFRPYTRLLLSRAVGGGNNDLGRGSHDLGRGMLKYKLSNP